MAGHELEHEVMLMFQPECGLLVWCAYQSLFLCAKSFLLQLLALHFFVVLISDRAQHFSVPEK